MILDTNAVSAFFEEVPAVCMAVGGSDVLAVPSIVLGEYRFGLSSSRLRAELEAKIGRLERLAHVLCVDAETARYYALIRRELKDAGTPIPDNDLWIAALVRQHGWPLLSNDTHFDHVKGLTRIAGDSSALVLAIVIFTAKASTDDESDPLEQPDYFSSLRS